MKNPVAKFARLFNHAKVFKDKIKDYSRKKKHKRKDETYTDSSD